MKVLSIYQIGTFIHAFGVVTMEVMLIHINLLVRDYYDVHSNSP